MYSWQQHQWQHLTTSLRDQKLPHALLLAGPKGTGKLHFAKRFAALLLCLSPVNQVACGRCKGCELLQADTHPDLSFLQPEDKSKVIKIDQVRGVIDFLAKTAQQGGRKVAIVEPAETLNISAANALLKSLEEPSGETTLLLVSHAPSQIMATIRSRCQMLAFPLPTREVSLNWLSPLAVGHDPEYLLHCAAGAPLAAFNLMSGDSLEQREAFAKSLLGIAQGRVSPLDAASQGQSSESLILIEWIMQLVQQAVQNHVLLASDTTSGSSIPADRPEAEIVSWLAATNSKIVFRFWDKLLVLKRQLLSNTNPNKQLLLEEVMMDWQALMKQSNKLQQSRQQMMNGLL